MNGSKVKIRGVYTTALTSILLAEGYTIVSPSQTIRQRFHIAVNDGQEDVAIFDRQDHRGVHIEGTDEPVAQIVQTLRKALPHLIVRPLGTPQDLGRVKGKLSWAEFVERVRRSYEIEFPYYGKSTLDVVRARATMTLPAHHLLKSINSKRVDEVEEELTSSHKDIADAAQELKKELIYCHYAVGRTITIAHVKPDGIIFKLKGKVKFFENLTLKFERQFQSGGSYDGLEVPKEEGDYGTVELQEGAWIIKRSYFARNGSPKGELYNINTPVEFYPQGPRYIDLEVDVARLPDGTVSVLDEAEVEGQVQKGFFSRELGDSALHLAYELQHRLQSKGQKGRLP